MKILTLVLLAAALAAPATARAQDEKRESPPNWRWHLEKEQDTTVRIWSMPPGIRLNPSYGGLWWDTTMVAKGNFAVDLVFDIYPDAANTGIGVIIGGKNLDTMEPTYLLFQIRQDGFYMIALRDKKLYHEIAPWKHLYQVNAPGETQPGRNVLRIEAGPSAIAFFSNGTRVQYEYRSMIKPEGIVGLRAGGSMDAQIVTFKILPL